MVHGAYTAAMKFAARTGFAATLLAVSGVGQTPDWTQVTTPLPNTPSARNAHAMAYDSVWGKTVMFGGDSTSGSFNDTWEYDGVNWTQISTASSPSARSSHAMVYDSVRGKVVLFGGYDNVVGRVNDTWEYDGGAPPVVYPSSAVSYGTGCGTPALDFSPTANPIIGATAGALISNAPTTLAGVTFGVSDTLLNGRPVLPYSLAGIGMPGCYLLQSNEVFGLPVTLITASTLQFDVSIPYSPALLTQEFYIQAYALAPGANAAQIVTSNGIAWTIGDQ